MQPFIIVFIARSGSTAIFGDLSNHPDIKMRAEVFGEKRLPGGMEQNDDNRIAFLHEYYSAVEEKTEKAAIKRAKGFKFQVTTNGQQFNHLWRLRKVLLEYNTKVIVLRREGLVHQLVSSLNAKRLMDISAKTRNVALPHIKAGDESLESLVDELASKKFPVNIKAFKCLFINLKKTYRILDKFGAAFPEVLDITYEEYLDDRLRVLTRIANYIGVDPDGFKPMPAYKKITSVSLENVVENYATLKRFAGNYGLKI